MDKLRAYESVLRKSIFGRTSSASMLSSANLSCASFLRPNQCCRETPSLVPGNVLLAGGLNRFDNRFEKDMDDLAHEQLGLAGYATSVVTRGTGGCHGRQAELLQNP
jgi:hypothetical protein